MSVARYSEYKDSGVEWLGKVPGHWEVKRIRYTSYLKGRVGWKGLTSDEYIEEGYAYLVTGTDFKSKFIDWSTCYCVDQSRYEDDPFIQLRNGDLLMTKDGTIGKVGLVSGLERPACLNSGIFLIRPISSYITEYLYWVLSSHVFSGFYELTSVGSTIKHLYQNVFEEFAFPIPTTYEQTAIATVLDRETAKIDELVEEQEKLIALLKEKRQAVISRAVTKGIDPSVSMRDSGIKWLGEVPEHWDVKKLKHIAGVQTGVAKGKDLSGKDTIVVPYLRVANVQDGYLDLSDIATIEISSSDLTRYSLQFGDVLMNEGGDFDKLGRGHIWRGEIAPCIHQNHVFAIRPTLVSSEWLNEITGSSYAQFYFMSRSKQSTNLASISSTNIMELPVILPPQLEQSEIMEFVENTKERTDMLIEESQRAISLLKERRNALISAAVTGKIDVRTLVAEGVSV